MKNAMKVTAHEPPQNVAVAKLLLPKTTKNTFIYVYTIIYIYILYMLGYAILYISIVINNLFAYIT